MNHATRTIVSTIGVIRAMTGLAYGIPLPMGPMPVIYLGAAAALLRSWPLAAATAVFAIGHLAVSQRDRRKIASLAR